MFDNDFDREYASFSRRFWGYFGVILVLNVVFWAALITILVLVLKHFGWL